MRQVANDLRAWLRLTDPAGDVPDLSEYGRRLRQVAAPRLTEAEERKRLEEICGQLSDRLASLVKPMERALLTEYPVTETDSWDEQAEKMLGFREGRRSAGVVAQDCRVTRLAGSGVLPLVLVIGRCVSVTDDGLAHITGSIELARERVMGAHERWDWPRVSVKADSVQATEAVEKLALDLQSMIGEWLERFIGVLEGGG
jgi:hypothetical protein